MIIDFSRNYSFTSGITIGEQVVERVEHTKTRLQIN